MTRTPPSTIGCVGSVVGACSFDFVESGGDVALGEVDHRGQRQDQSGIDAGGVESRRRRECTLGFGETARHERHPAMHDRQPFVGLDHVAESFDVAGDGVGPSDVEQLRCVVGHDVGRLDAAVGPEEVLDRRNEITCLGVPPPGCGVEGSAALGKRPLQLRSQQVAQQVMEAEPGAGAVE